jgi:hypothetical protein
MITQTDIKRLKLATNKCSLFGEKINVVISKISGAIGSKVVLVGLCVVLGICYFTVGVFGRKE